MPTDAIKAKADRLANRAVLRLAFYFTSEDATVVRDFNMADIEAGQVPEFFTPGKQKKTEIPDWVLDPLQQWPHPQDPVTYSGIVRPDREADAWAVMTENLPVKIPGPWMEAEGG